MSFLILNNLDKRNGLRPFPTSVFILLIGVALCLAPTSVFASYNPTSGTDNLDSVSDRGATTDQSLTTGGLTVSSDNTVGLSSGKGRIEFEDESIDNINLTNANVGIGTTQPTAKLQIVATGANNAAAALLVNGTTTTSNLVVTNAGNVGIGTSIPSSKLTVNGAVSVTGNSTYTGTMAVSGASTFAAGPDRGFYIASDGGTSIYSDTAFHLFDSDGHTLLYLLGNGYNGDIVFSVGNAFSITRPIAFVMNQTTSKFTFTQGNIGVGMTDPIARLHIANTGRLSSFQIDDYWAGKVAQDINSLQTTGAIIDIDATKLSTGKVVGVTIDDTYDDTAAGLIDISATSVDTTTSIPVLRIATTAANDVDVAAVTVARTGSNEAKIIYDEGDNAWKIDQGEGAGAVTISTGGASTDDLDDVADRGATTDQAITTAGLIVSSDNTVGLSSGKGRIEFEDESIDNVNITNANVGLGTTEPTAKLSVIGTGANNRALSLLVTGSTTTANLVVTNAGNVGVGTSSPSSKLTVSGNSAFTGAMAVSGNSTFAGTMAVSGMISTTSGVAIVSDSPLSIRDSDDHSVASLTGNSYGENILFSVGGAGFFAAPSKKSVYFILDQNLQKFIFTGGNIGLGTTEPVARLNIINTGPASSIRIDDYWAGKVAQDINSLQTTGTIIDIDATKLSTGKVIGMTIDDTYDDTAAGLVDITATSVDTTTSIPVLRVATTAANDVDVAAVTIARTGGNAAKILWDEGADSWMIDNGTNAPAAIATGSGSGTVNTGAARAITYYPSAGTTVDDTANLFSDGTRVGIGTSAPSARLQLIATGTSNASVNLAVGTTTATGMVVTNAGNVGIGTTAPAFSLVVNKDQDSTTILGITNPNAGQYARSLLIIGEDNSTKATGIGYSNSNANFGSSYIDLAPNSGLVYAGAGATGGLNISAIANNAPITFFTGGEAAANQRMRISGTGNVGIGTTAPTLKLEVVATGSSNAAMVLSAGNTTGSKGLFVTNLGNVGVGTTTPKASLDVTNEIRVLGGVGYGTVPSSGTGLELAYDTSTDIGAIVSYNRSTSAYKKIQIESSSLAINGASTGNVGIGTTAPRTRLEVTNTVSLGVTANNSGQGRVGIGTTGPTARLQILATGSSAAALSLNVSSGALNVTNAGKVGIGTTAPGGKLEINNNFVFTSMYDNGNSSTSKTIDWSNGTYQKITMTGNCVFTFTAPGGIARVALKLIQDGTGGRTASWPATVKWPGGTAPTLTTDASGVDFVSCVYDGTNYYCVDSLDFK